MLVSTRLQQHQIVGQNRLARTTVLARAVPSQQKPYRASRRATLAVSANFIFNALNQGKIALAVSQAGEPVGQLKCWSLQINHSCDWVLTTDGC